MYTWLNRIIILLCYYCIYVVLYSKRGVFYVKRTATHSEALGFVHTKTNSWEFWRKKKRIGNSHGNNSNIAYFSFFEKFFTIKNQNLGKYVKKMFRFGLFYDPISTSHIWNLSWFWSLRLFTNDTKKNWRPAQVPLSTSGSVLPEGIVS